MTETNCGVKIRCPECGQENEVIVEAIIRIRVSEDGIQQKDLNFAWNDDSPCYCPECEFSGAVKDFRIDHQHSDHSGS